MKQSLQLKMGQSLALTPQLQQAIKLLQLSTLDLQQAIEETLESNPLLEREEEGEGREGGRGWARRRKPWHQRRLEEKNGSGPPSERPWPSSGTSQQASRDSRRARPDRCSHAEYRVRRRIALKGQDYRRCP